MIVKRRVSKQFVQLANEIVRDRSIPLDAHGMLHYLLSLPDNWEINLRQIETFWSIGRAKRQRIFQDLLNTGWLEYEKIQNDVGDYVGSRWIVTDDPQPPQTKIDDIEEDGEPLVATKSAPAPESQGPDGAALQDDRQRSRAVDDPGGGRETRPPQNRAVESRKQTLQENLDSKNTTAERETEPDGLPPPPFGIMLRVWPRDNINSAFACQNVFSKLTEKQQADAHAGMKPYLEDARSKGQTRLCDLRTYLDERRWERFTDRTHSSTVFWTTKRGTPQAGRWRTYYAEEKPRILRLFDEMMATRGFYTTPSEWPPAKGTRQSGTDPPDTLTDEDAREFIQNR